MAKKIKKKTKSAKKRAPVEDRQEPGQKSNLLALGLSLSLVVVALVICLRLPVVQHFINQWKARSRGLEVHAENYGREICDVDRWLSPEQDTVGFHVLCVAETEKGLEFTGFRSGAIPRTPDLEQVFFIAEAQDLQAFRKVVEDNMGLRVLDDHPIQYRQPWATYSEDGRRLETIEEILDAQIVFVFEGGQWIYPGVKIGNVIETTIPDIGPVVLTTLSMSPLVVQVSAFLTSPECDYIMEQSEPHIAKSGVALMDRDKGKPASTWRTSSQYWLSAHNKPIVQNIDVRVSNLTRIPVNHQEDIQVLRYLPGEKYDAHHDYFDPSVYSGAQLENVQNGYKNRLATVFSYMTDVEEGGETWFPRSGHLPPITDFTKCEGGLLVKPQRGAVIIFYSMLPDGSLDPYSLHGGCPPHNDGIKWSANKWIWNKPQKYVKSHAKHKKIEAQQKHLEEVEVFVRGQDIGQELVVHDCGITDWLAPAHEIDGFHILCVKQVAHGCRDWVWQDSQGDSCRAYEAFRNGDACQLAPHFSNADGIDATDACCFCKGGSTGISITAYPHGTLPKDGPKIFGTRTVSLKDFRRVVERFIPLDVRDDNLDQYQQPWSAFSTDGLRLEILSDITNAGAVFIFEGGQWLWPGVEVGHVSTTDVPFIGEVSLTTLSMSPLVISVSNFLGDEECDEIIRLSEPGMKKSGVALKARDEGKPADTWRTSSQYWLKSTGLPMVQRIDTRVANITRTGVDQQEHVQVLRYEETERYVAHHDYFDPSAYTDDYTLDMIQYGYRNRLATVFWYMTDVEEGGETAFPRSEHGPPVSDYTDCTKGLLVPPIRGNVIIFYSMLPSGRLDEYSLHGGCPPKKGTKWAANKWVWNKVHPLNM